MSATHPHLYPVLICEDYGTRLWPIAREEAPACFAPVVAGSDRTLFADCVGRCFGLGDCTLVVVTTEQLAPVVESELREQLGMRPDAYELLVEPEPRGSAFTIALASAYVRRKDPDALMAVFPTNQRTEFDDRMDHLVERAYELAVQDRVVLVGGQQEDKCGDNSYIRVGHELDAGREGCAVRQFAVDVAPAAAQRAHQMGALWYAGIFFARAAVVLGELALSAERSGSSDAAALNRIVETASFLSMLERESWLRDDAREVIRTLPVVSYERAALELSTHLACLPTTVRFDTIASIEDLAALVEPDVAGNHCIGSAVAVDSRNTTLYSQQSDRLVVGLGLADVTVVDTPDALLVAQSSRLRDREDVFTQLRRNQAVQLRSSARRLFPWGHATLVVNEQDTATWHVTMRPGASLDTMGLPHVFGVFDGDICCEHYSVLSGSLLASGEADGDALYDAGGQFSSDVEHPLTLLAGDGAPARLVLTAVRLHEGPAQLDMPV